MLPASRPHLLVLAASLLLACSGNPRTDRRLRIGHEPDDAMGGSAGVSGGGQVGDGGLGVGSNALSVRVRDQDEMTIEVITFACAGDCADIEAVARGGNAPYSFAWDDGSTNAKRHVCLDSSTVLSVRATDTGIVAEEFEYEAHTVRAEVRADVLACSADGGVGADVCLENLGLEGTPTINLGSFMLPGWTDCGIFGGADVCDAALATTGGFAPPSEGKTAVYFGGMAGAGDLLGTQLCAPLEPGQATSFLIDLWSGADKDGNFGHLEIAAGSASCERSELLWTSPTLDDTWQRVCVTLQPAQEHTTLTFVPSGLIAVDNIVPVVGCP